MFDLQCFSQTHQLTYIMVAVVSDIVLLLQKCPSVGVYVGWPSCKKLRSIDQLSFSIVLSGQNQPEELSEEEFLRKRGHGAVPLQ